MRLFVPYQVRRGLRYGYVVADSTHYATIEWEPYTFEEVDQLDTSVEVVGPGVRTSVEDLEEDLEELEDDIEDAYEDIDTAASDTERRDAEREMERLVMRKVRLEEKLEKLRDEPDEAEDSQTRYAIHLAEEGHRARTTAAAQPDDAEQKEAA